MSLSKKTLITIDFRKINKINQKEEHLYSEEISNVEIYFKGKKLNQINHKKRLFFKK